MAGGFSGHAAAAVARYNAFVSKQPFVANASTGFVIASVGDYICQRYFEGDKPYDARRTLELGVIRAFVMAPFLSVYFPWLNSLMPGASTPRVATRVLIDQCVGSPVSISMIFGAVCLLQATPEAFVPRVQQQLIPTWQAGAMYWPFVHAINFKFVPVAHQPLVAHAASLWWNAVLSYRANMKLQVAAPPTVVAG